MCADGINLSKRLIFAGLVFGLTTMTAKAQYCAPGRFYNNCIAQQRQLELQRQRRQEMQQRRLLIMEQQRQEAEQQRQQQIVEQQGQQTEQQRQQQLLEKQRQVAVGATAPLLGSDIARMDEMIALNVGALACLTYAAAPGFVARGGGTIVNIASIAAISPETLNGVHYGSKAFVLAISQSLHHELADKGVRIQVVLPGATATEFWNIAGLPVHNLPAATVMSAEDMVDTALAGLEQGEVVTIPALPDKAEWDAFEAARHAMSGRLSGAAPAI
jgi:NAD(P)-dependent dehydrogenase (short-subunit alcohol dehydrogenase family)